MKIKHYLGNIYYSFQRFFIRLFMENSIEKIRCRKEYADRIKSLHNIHFGQRCFIIGNGPSLTAIDLDSLKEEYTFAANRIFYIFEKTQWRPTYFCAQDMDVIRDSAEKFSIVEECVKHLFLISDCMHTVPISIRKSEKTLFFCPKYVKAHKKRLFSSDISHFISGGGTVTYSAIQIAVYMGFKEIYLIGVDHSYASASFNNNSISLEDIKKSYFEGMPENIKISMPNTDNATISYLKAKEYCRKHNIIIKNATRGGKLEVFERITLEEILENE